MITHLTKVNQYLDTPTIQQNTLALIFSPFFYICYPGFCWLNLGKKKASMCGLGLFRFPCLPFYLLTSLFLYLRSSFWDHFLLEALPFEYDSRSKPSFKKIFIIALILKKIILLSTQFQVDISFFNALKIIFHSFYCCYWKVNSLSFLHR